MSSAVETIPGRIPARHQESEILPAMIEVPCRLHARLRVASGDLGIQERLTANVILHRTVRLQLSLILMLGRTVLVVLAGSVIDRCDNRSFEVREIKLLKVAGRNEWPHPFDVLIGKNISRFEIRFGVHILLQPLVERLSRVGLDVLSRCCRREQPQEHEQGDCGCDRAFLACRRRSPRPQLFRSSCHHVFLLTRAQLSICWDRDLPFSLQAVCLRFYPMHRPPCIEPQGQPQVPSPSALECIRPARSCRMPTQYRRVESDLWLSAALREAPRSRSRRRAARLFWSPTY